MAIAFLSNDYNGTFPWITPGGCTYYRCLLPMSVAGHKARMGMPAWDPIRGFGVKETTATGIFGFDKVVLKLIMSKTALAQVDLAQKLGQKVIVDIDDYHEGLTPANKAYAITDPESNKRSNREIYEQIIRKADAVIVSTPFLYDIYKERNERVFMIRNGVNTNQFTKRKHTHAKPIIGWAGAISYRNNDLEQLREWLPGFLEEHDLMFHHAGHEPADGSFAEVTGVPSHRVTTSPIVTIDRYADGLRFDIGLVPLSDIPFNYAKSNIKGLEYAASGIPFVASDLPEYRLLHEFGVGRLARTAEDWRLHLKELLDYTLRKREAARQYQTVTSDWSIQARAEEWQYVLGQI